MKSGMLRRTGSGGAFFCKNDKFPHINDNKKS